ncbi:hypothetical protein B0J13DRAFT_535068 [Dactylonectria estremocensis]|uniref:Secreted protein n=1 Tax=Dactylonectria estremocensis TaxID=1079267 RepID=A0A9P9JHV0_9HYPO|nr:hypothetical protein B0J13DRAFT_535068 [Dactylonectria estremocensis]
MYRSLLLLGLSFVFTRSTFTPLSQLGSRAHHPSNLADNYTPSFWIGKLCGRLAASRQGRMASTCSAQPPSLSWTRLYNSSLHPLSSEVLDHPQLRNHLLSDNLCLNNQPTSSSLLC